MTTKKKPTYETSNAASYLTALLLGVGASNEQASEGLGDALRAGLRPVHLPTPATRKVLELSLGGLVGEPLRGFALQEGIATQGFAGVLEDDAYRFRSRSCPGNWAQRILLEHRYTRVVRYLEDLKSGGPAGLGGFDAVGLGDLLQSRAGVPDLYSAQDCYAALREELEGLDNLRESGQALATGYPGLDLLLGSLLPGDCTVVAARTSVGKTKFALNIVDNIATKGHPAHVFSLEMSRARVLGRLWSIHTGCQTPETARQLTGAAYAYSDKPVWICDTGSLGAGDICSRVRFAEVRPKLVAVDYLGLMDHGDSERLSEASAVGRSVRLLRSAGRELGFHLLLLSQINRAGVADGSAPQLHHLRGSGDIEQDADAILMLGRKGDDMTVDVAKNRNTGRTGRVTLRPHGLSCRLEEV